eukprot:8688131-Pyramimonas_sp.AAC.1
MAQTGGGVGGIISGGESGGLVRIRGMNQGVNRGMGNCAGIIVLHLLSYVGRACHCTRPTCQRWAKRTTFKQKQQANEVLGAFSD